MHKSYFLLIIVASIKLPSCTESTKTPATQQTISKDTTVALQSKPYIPVGWIDSARVEIQMNKILSYVAQNINCDSVLGIWYTGFEGEHFYYPVNNEGKWINKIHAVAKLNSQQKLFLETILGDANSFKNPLIIPCFEPRHAVVYFKNGKVIGQTSICLGCARLSSSIKTGDRKREGLFNNETRANLTKLFKELEFGDE